ncbi:MAG: CoA-binding protein [Candidatus Bathyarchaeia archaeon]
MSDIIAQLDLFFKAKSVAVIGASSTRGKIGYEVLKSLCKGEYKGEVYPVTLGKKRILGLKCYRSILEIPGKVELAVVIVPSKKILSVLKECGNVGVRNVVIISAGFKEMGGEFAQIEQEVKKLAKEYSMRIIGPNCIGVYDSETKLDTFFQPRVRMLRPPPGGVAIMSQSGAYGLTLLEWIAESRFGVSKFVSYGNRVDVDEADLIRYFKADEKTKIIAIYVEGVENGRKFLEAAKETSKEKPILVLKAGKTGLGSEGALTHTGSLAGSYEVYKAAFKQANLIEAETLAELFDMMKALAMQPPAEGRNIAMTSNGMGPCIAAMDICERRNLTVGEYGEETVNRLKERLPPYCVVGRVVDLSGSATSKDYEATLEAFLEDEKVSLLMPFFIFQDAPLDEGIIDVLRRVRKKASELQKPIICGASGGPYTRKQVKEVERIGIPVYETPERAVSAAHALIKAGEILKR